MVKMLAFHLINNIENYMTENNKSTFKYVKTVETDINIIKSDLKEVKILSNEIDTMEDMSNIITFITAEINYWENCIKIYKNNDVIINGNSIIKITKEHLTEAKKVKKELHNIKNKLKR